MRSLLEWLLGAQLPIHLPVALVVGAPSPVSPKRLVNPKLSWTDWCTVPRTGERVYYGSRPGKPAHGVVVDVVYHYQGYLGPHVEVWIAAD